MLCELVVRNLALIEDVRIELAPGFCAWTGETGAGKTLLLEALGLVLGERGSVELIRRDADELLVAARFHLDSSVQTKAVEESLGVPLEEGELVLTRRLGRSGRGQSYANELPVTVAALRRVAPLLIDVHGQRDSLSLLESNHQLDLLDSFGGHDAAFREYVACRAEVLALRERQTKLQADRERRARDLALLRFERDELDGAKLRLGEVVELTAERRRLTHAQGLGEFATASIGILHDDDGALIDRVGRLRNDAERWLAHDAGLSQIVERLDALGRELKDLADSIRILARHWRQDPERLAAVDERLLLLRRLETKYGRSVDDLVVYRAELDERERELETEQRDCVATSDKLLGAFAACRDAGRRLGQLRRQAAKKLIRAARRHLTELGMPDAALGVSLTPIDVSGDPMTADLPGLGFERLELLLAANPGEPALPLRRVASGGELSRAMLALKSALAGHDRVGTMIFDEIDANVGGRLGHVLGRKLAALSKNRQVICVTHLPQVAACAPRQWSIRKQRSGQRTVATIQPLDERQRLDELAVMLRGDAHSETTRREAAAMLKAGKAWW